MGNLVSFQQDSVSLREITPVLKDLNHSERLFPIHKRIGPKLPGWLFTLPGYRGAVNTKLLSLSSYLAQAYNRVQFRDLVSL